MVFGHADVSIPASHKRGDVEGQSYFKFEIKENPNKHIVLKALKPQSADNFFAEVSRRAGQGERSAFLFVHGYYVKFNDAAKRAAQITYDLKFAGAPIFFSWPSTGKYLGYVVDEGNVEYAPRPKALPYRAGVETWH